MKLIPESGLKLITGMILLLVSGALMAGNNPASYVKPDVDLSVYKRVMVRPLNMDNMELLKPAWEQDNDEVWTANPGNGPLVQEWFMDAMQKQLEVEGGYALVSEAAEDVMRIEVEVLSVTPYVKPGTPFSDGKFEISTLGSGDVAISAEIRDAKTRELLILVEGEQTIGEEYRKLTRENHIANIKGLFDMWGKRVRETLDKAHGK
ncbi:MAG: DUF3313 family protein [Lysobacterales bacterium]|jgi:hypothetical protein